MTAIRYPRFSPVRFPLAAAAVLFLVLPVARAGAQVSSRSEEPIVNFARPKSPADPIQKEFYSTWLSLPGTYEATNAKNGETLKLTLKAIPDYVLFLELTGNRGGEKILERGYLNMSIAAATYDKKLTVSYRPDTIGRQYSCLLIGVLTPGGLTGDTGASDCSFPAHEKVSKWKVDATSDAIVITDASGDTTRFTRVAAVTGDR